MNRIKRCLLLALAVLLTVSGFTIPVAAKRGYTTVSTTGVELEFPDEDDFLKTMKTAKAKASRSNGSIYIMPMPEKGNGNLGNVMNNETVYLIAKRGSYYFFVTKEGHFGWNGTKYFNVKKTVSPMDIVEAVTYDEDSEAEAIFYGNDDYSDFMFTLYMYAMGEE